MRGRIEQLRSGALRVVVYAGVDPVSKRRNYLRETIPAGPKAESEAKAALVRLVNEVNQKSNPRTSASVAELFMKYFDVVNKAASSLRRDLELYQKHIEPVLGTMRASAVDSHILDSLYAALLRCRERCGGRVRGHQCAGLAPSTVRRIHFLISTAFGRAVRWGWITRNPADSAIPPPQPSPDPQPPSAEDAARIINNAWDDPAWGAFVWLASTTGCRRGELCALKWEHVDLTNGTLTIRRSIDQDGTILTEKDTKSHQQRRIALDSETVAVLADHKDRAAVRAKEFKTSIDRSSYVFSPEPDGSTPPKPSTMTQRYRRLAERLDINSSLHKLRHYSATELISAGVDPRTVSGRLGHSGGGATTLRVYSAWVTESDQRAAKSLSGRMPTRPDKPGDRSERAKVDPRWPYETIAHEIRSKILNGTLAPGSQAPTQLELAREHHVSVGTANRAIELLKTWGVIEASRGRRSVILDQPSAATQVSSETDATHGTSNDSLLDLSLAYLGKTVRKFRAEGNLHNPKKLRELLTNAAERHSGGAPDLAKYELEVRDPASGKLLTSFAAL